MTLKILKPGERSRIPNHLFIGTRFARHPRAHTRESQNGETGKK